MAQSLTEAARRASEELGIEPQLVLKIDGISTCFGATILKEKLKYGSGAKYGDAGLVYGGLTAISDQSDSIDLKGTSTKIRQQLEPDRGAVSSVGSVKVRLLDSNNELTKIISPGVELTDPLSVTAKLFLGFQDTSFPEDYILLFQGIIEDIVSGAGFVELTLTHPDQKKRSKIFKQANDELAVTLSAGATGSMTLSSTADFLAPKVGDTITKHYVVIEEEVIRFTGISGATLTGLTRGEFGTSNVTHTSGTEVVSFFTLESDAVKLALSVMLSDPDNEFFATGVDVTNFVRVSGTETVSDSIFFEGVDLEFTYGLTTGDLFTTTGATNGANNVVLATITDIVTTDLGSYLISDGAGFVEENDSAATISFKSEYNTLVDGLKMIPSEVDVERHEFLRNTFLSSFSYRVMLKDTIEGKELLEKEIYLPYAMYAVPRKGRSSVALHIAPLPTEVLPTLNKDNIKEPSKIRLRRTFSRNFYNTIIHKFELDAIEDKFLAGVITLDGTSLSEIKVGTRDLTIESKGMRTDLTGGTNASTSGSRLLSRYKRGAEFFEQVRVQFATGFNIDVADLVIFDFDGLFVSNTEDGSRTKESKIFEVTNRTVDIRTGDIQLTLTDTNFNGQSRFGLISPASFIKDGISTTQFVIKPSFNEPFGSNEFRKWQDYVGAAIKVRSEDFSTQGDTVLQSLVGNTFTVDPPLAFTPSADMIVEMDDYSAQTTAGADKVKLVYTFMSDVTFADGGDQYAMI